MSNPARRQLIICCDGTNNNLTGGKDDTNVVKLLKFLAPDESGQVLFYDPGVGNAGALPGTTVWDKMRRFYERIEGLALGRGIYENVAEAYLFLMRNYQPNDEIYFFGFSRGAFTARCIAGLVNQFGILRPSMEGMVPTLLHVYFSARKSAADQAANKAITAQIRGSFCAAAQQQVPIQFVGVWDTVASVGAWPFQLRISARPTIAGKCFIHVRQALALDEHRVPFKPRPYADSNGDVAAAASQTSGASGPTQTMKQLWFRGSHCDVGGGNPANASELSDTPLVWLLAEAAQCGLRLRYHNADLQGEQSIAVAWADGLSVKGGHQGLRRISAEPYSLCLWAVAGLRVRDPAKVEVDDEPTIEVNAAEHPSVATDSMAFPKNTVWAKSRPVLPLICAALLGLLGYFAMGQLLSQWVSSGSVMTDLVRAAQSLPEYARQNVQFAHWQLAWMGGGEGLGGYTKFGSPRWALVVDCAFMLSYAYVLAWFFVRGFARMAGLNRVGRKPSALLGWMGYSLSVLVLADVCEDIFTWLLITIYPYSFAAAFVLGLGMSLAALVKLAAFAVVIGFLAWSRFAKPAP